MRTFDSTPLVRPRSLLAVAMLLALIALLLGSDSTQAQSGAPVVSAVAVTSDAGDDSTYALGEIIRVAVTFSEAVDVTGTPRLSIDMDPAEWGTKQAAYDSGTGTTRLIFIHTVTQPNISTQGIAVLADTLELNGGTIKSAASQTDANLSHTGLDHDASHKVDWQLSPPPPSVGRVAVTSDAGDDSTYALGEIIRVAVTFSEAVDVTGTPRLSIDMDPAEWGTKQAAYDSGTGTTRLIFIHTVTQPNISTQGIAVLADTLELNGGTIKSAASQTDANLSHTGLDHDASHKVDWQQAAAPTPTAKPSPTPSVSAVAITSDAGADDTYAKDEVIEVTLTFSEAVNVTGTPRLSIDMDPAEWGEKQAAYDSGTGTTRLIFIHTVTQPNISTQGIAVLADTLELNGGTIRSATSDQDAELSHAGLAHDASHKVDWQTTSTCVPGAAASVSALGIERGVVVTWTMPEGNSEACRVTGFAIEGNADGLSFTQVITDPDARSATIVSVTPGEYDIAVYVTYGELQSEPAFDYNTYVPADCSISLTVAADFAYGVSGSWTNAGGSGVTGCESGGVRIDFKKASESAWSSSHTIPNKKEQTKAFIIGGLETA